MKVHIIFFLLFLLSNNPSYGQRKSVYQNLQIAIEFIDKNQETKALPYLDKCLSKQPDNQEALFLRAGILNNQEQVLEALTDYNALLSLDPENKEALYSRGTLRYQLEQYDMALEDFEKCLGLPSRGTNTAYFKIDPLSDKASGISTISRMKADLWNYIGLCYYQLGKLEKALESYDQGLALEQNHLDLHINRALVYEEMNEYKLAKEAYQTILNMDPDHERASINLLRMQSGNEKIRKLSEYILNHPDQPIGYADRGLAYYNLNKFEMAENDLAMAAKLSSSTDYKLNLALSKMKLNKLEEAESVLLEITETDPNNSKTYFNLGNIQYMRAHYNEAISYFTLAIQKENDNPSFYYNRALAYHGNGQIENACEDMNFANMFNPGTGSEFIIKYCADE